MAFGSNAAIILSSMRGLRPNTSNAASNTVRPKQRRRVGASGGVGVCRRRALPTPRLPSPRRWSAERRRARAPTVFIAWRDRPFRRKLPARLTLTGTSCSADPLGVEDACRRGGQHERLASCELRAIFQLNAHLPSPTRDPLRTDANVNVHVEIEDKRFKTIQTKPPKLSSHDIAHVRRGHADHSGRVRLRPATRSEDVRDGAREHRFRQPLFGMRQSEIGEDVAAAVFHSQICFAPQDDLMQCSR